MAGIGSPPKDPSKRARRNSDVVPLRVVQVVPDRQPGFVETFGPVNALAERPWHENTLEFWEQLGEFPTTRGLLSAQWSLLGVAVMHYDLVMRGQMQYAAEMRLELAKFGIAPDDVARLRFSFAQADQAEARVPARSRSRYENLTASDALEA
jgi:hypothetical protein